MKAEKFTLLRHFDGWPQPSDFQLESEELAELQEGEFLCEAEYLSVDPYMRPYSRNLQPPTTMIGSQVGRVLESRCERFPVGSRVVGALGWRSRSVVKGDTPPAVFGVRPLPELGGLPDSYALGSCGMPGNTAYYGFLELCQPKEGETVVVTGAAGAVGSLVGQIAKVKGCRVVGFAGTDAKCDWLKTLGFDATINYKTCPDIDAALKTAAPDGVDCYFDNVGGMLSQRIRQQMNLFGRISVCGCISSYNEKTGEEVKVEVPEKTILFKQLRVEGFIVSRWDKEDLWQKGVQQMAAWIRDGKIKVQETVTEGFEKMPQAFIGMLQGENTGKAVVKAAAE
ncbi:LOW QUALITY PROTEIN: prostaglandin reductase 1-like [Pollicipes pollicipes]|uniref:LOW QUALITY PROTEIN: prostaglandin reductase 1-like n=1 Tax=Pollicipes pollicipes TaxID=41117 RepID=UPI0018852499|nr:LOW QUALITY PROTEIN: prostaglandin reductase 1-like [Pollicipes pollicipes]